jgi:hypothetical protein
MNAAMQAWRDVGRVYGLTKEALAAAAPPPDGLDPQVGHVLAGGAALGGGAYALAQAQPLATGRTRYYHGTTASNLANIQQHGLRPASSGVAKGITEVLAPDIQQKAKDMVYLTPHRMRAGGYAGQAAFLQNNPVTARSAGSPVWNMEREVATIGGAMNPFQKGVAKADIPLWRKEIADKLRANPETRGSFAAFHKAMGGDVAQSRATYDSLNSALTVEGGLASKYFHGAKDYQRLGLKELGEYARQHPGRFAGGLGLGALGAAGIGYGAHRLYRAATDKPAQLSPPSPSK